MIDNIGYTNKEVVQNLYTDFSRIDSRGEFLRKYSNRKLSVRDVIRVLVRDQKKKVVLDYGCGSGSFLRSLASLSDVEKCYALDVVKHDNIDSLPPKIKYIDILPSVPNKHLGPVDLLFCMNVLYHLGSSERVVALEWFKRNIRETGQIIITTKSEHNYLFFRKILDTLVLDYPAYADESCFSSENALEQVVSVFSPEVYEVNVYPLGTQIITDNFSDVLNYMFSCVRYKELKKFSSIIFQELTRNRLYIDTYYETIICIKRRYV